MQKWCGKYLSLCYKTFQFPEELKTKSFDEIYVNFEIISYPN